MAIELSAAMEVAASGVQSVEKLIGLFSPNAVAPTVAGEYQTVADDAVCKFTKFISLLHRSHTTGHARFRSVPVTTPPRVMEPTRKIEESGLGSMAQLPVPAHIPPSPTALTPGKIERKEASKKLTMSLASSAASFASSLTGDTDGLQPSMMSSEYGFQVTNLSQVISSFGRLPLSKSSVKRKCCGSMDDSGGKCGGGSSRCHCPKQRKSKSKRVVRVPATSMKLVDIPPDDYSWRKYGQKPIKGSPHPRGYYKCSSVRGCPARKHVERALDDPTMLIVTYGGGHNHTLSGARTPAMVLQSS